ncbi:MAG TPA: alpha/beta hydrolase, partial [Pedobacter sp.]|uniref:alpha/beta fold hydrolase n=1 Tax=Pedobacter sp. TaxID=1411316 RepID=UPI002BB60673
MAEHMKNNAKYFILIIAGLISCNPAGEKKVQPGIENQKVGAAEKGYADVNGLKMYYEVHGKGKPLVLIHGSFMTIPLNWAHIIPLLDKDRKVIVAEMQGHGRTRDISREISFEGMADDVSGLLRHLKIDSADILGYSMGGGVAFQMAVRHPEQVRRLIVVSGV